MPGATDSQALQDAVAGLDLSDFPLGELENFDLLKNLQMAGANGTTELLASQLEKLARKLLEEGTISEAEAGALLKLANQGHEIARVEALLEDAASRAGNDLQAFEQIRIEYNGTVYSPKELGVEIGWRHEKPKDLASGDPFNMPTEAGSVMQTFINLHNSANVNDPAIKTLVSDLASKIIATAESVETFTCNSDKAFSPNNMGDVVASQAAHAYSGGICRTGGGKDKGDKCKK